MAIRGFLLSGRDIDSSWAFVQSAGLKIDYLLFKRFPLSKVDKFIKLAEITIKEQVELAQALHLSSLNALFSK